MNAWKLRELRGVFPVLQLPYTDGEVIDYATLHCEIDWLFSRGAQGVAVAMVSEILRLTTEERKGVAEEVCRRAVGRGPAIISVGAESTFVAVELAEHAEAVGAAAVMATPPLGLAPLRDECLRYYERIINSTGLPVIVQDASGYIGQALGTEFQAELWVKFGAERVGFKPEAVPLGPQLAALKAATDGQAHLFDGSGGGALAEAYRIGISGTMPGSDLIDGIIALWNALERSDQEAINAISQPLAAIVSLQRGLDGFLAVEKHLLKRQGIFRNAVVRGPVGFHLDEQTRSTIDLLFDELQSVAAAYQSPTAPSS